MKPVGIGILGCGNISPAYFRGCAPYDWVRIAACADLDPARAQARAREFGVPRALTVDALLADPEVELVVNLTVPQAHVAVNRAILEAGRHAYVEKPFSLEHAEAVAVLGQAEARGLRVGAAPDTFLGGGIQTCRGLVDAGAIGRPVAATAFCCSHGHEHWHPDPRFYYARGGGPMFDMGPYYLTALVNLLGPVRRVSGSTTAGSAQRTVTSAPLAGTVVAVETPTHLAGTLDFAGGAVATMVMSFDIWAHHLPCIEIHGTEGSLVVPDPNTFGGEVLLRRGGEREWRVVPHTHATEVGRGTGVAEMALALRHGRRPRASGELAAHVVEVMQAFEASSSLGRHVTIASQVERPEALPTGLPPGRLE